MVELENKEGIMKLSRDMSSNRLFCRGVPVSSKRCSAYRGGERTADEQRSDQQHKRLSLETGVRSKREWTTCQRTNVNGHEVAVAQRVHVLQHVAFVKQGVLQTQLAKQAAVAVISDGQVIPVRSDKSKINTFTNIHSYCSKINC